MCQNHCVIKSIKVCFFVKTYMNKNFGKTFSQGKIHKIRKNHVFRKKHQVQFHRNLNLPHWKVWKIFRNDFIYVEVIFDFFLDVSFIIFDIIFIKMLVIVLFLVCFSMLEIRILKKTPVILFFVACILYVYYNIFLSRHGAYFLDLLKAH